MYAALTKVNLTHEISTLVVIFMLLIRRSLTFDVYPKINKPHSVGKRHYTKALHRTRAQPCRVAKDDDFISPIIQQPDKSREFFQQNRLAISIMH